MDQQAARGQAVIDQSSDEQILANDLRAKNNSGLGLPTWKDLLAFEKQAAYFQNILSFLRKEAAAGQQIFPPPAEIFNALTYTPFDQVKVVIIGQDPYHAPGQAHGLCFSVRRGVALPPSLRNIYQELTSDLGIAKAQHGCLEKWARQGVLMLNTVLTVERGLPASHKDSGWERFTDKVVELVNQHRTGVVFLLWGSHAQRKCTSIDRTKHHLLCAPHPSPFSAHSGFFGCKHFSKTNQLLREQGLPEIDWRID